jgi:hypothetical protein
MPDIAAFLSGANNRQLAAGDIFEDASAQKRSMNSAC